MITDLRMDRDPLGGGTALFSACDKYRYLLERPLHPRTADRKPGHRLVSCGLNPSTADAFKLDATTRREAGYGVEWGCEVYVKINAYAWRDTHPSAMRRARRGGADIVGPSNDRAIEMELTKLKRDGGIALASWGTLVKPDRVLQLVRMAHAIGVQWMCVDVNTDGSPCHLIRRRLRSGDDNKITLRAWPT